MKCPNPGCGGFVDEYVNDRGGGSHYCLSACGYEATIPEGTHRPPRRRVTPPEPKAARRPPPRRR